MSNSLRPHGLYPARLLCPWDSPGKNAGVGSCFLLKGIFLAQGLNPPLLFSPALASRFFTHWAISDIQWYYGCFLSKKTEVPKDLCLLQAKLSSFFGKNLPEQKLASFETNLRSYRLWVAEEIRRGVYFNFIMEILAVLILIYLGPGFQVG